jgi:hypothetical protein
MTKQRLLLEFAIQLTKQQLLLEFAICRSSYDVCSYNCDKNGWPDCSVEMQSSMRGMLPADRLAAAHTPLTNAPCSTLNATSTLDLVFLSLLSHP